MSPLLSTAGRNATAVAVLLLAVAARPAAACAFDGTIGLNLAPAHPQALGVAMSVRAAADAGVLDAALLDPNAAGTMGFVRANHRLYRLGMSFAASDEAMPPLAVLFVESSLWTRYAGSLPQVHAPGAEAGDVVAVTSEAVVAALLDGRLSGADAVRRGLISLDGPPEAVQRAGQALDAAFPSRG